MEEVSTTERQYPRFAHEVAVRLHVGKTATAGRTNNVSRGGLCANVDDQVAPGTDVVVDITLVFDDGMQSEALSLPARVAWCTTVDDAYQIGLSFKALDAERADYLQLFLKYLGEERGPRKARPTMKPIDDRFG
jgi:hypothetical protein